MVSDDRDLFKYRVSAVVLRGDELLIHRAEIDDFWALPGGHVEMMESSKKALGREMKEELGVEVEVKRLVWIAENFFEYDGHEFHEVCLYYLVKIPEDSEILKKDEVFYGEEDGYEYFGRKIELIFKWYPVDKLEDIKLYPNFLVEAIRDLPDNPEHVVNDTRL